MKKLSFLLGAVALLTASCSNDEVVEVAQPQQGIGFSTFVDRSTRALEKDDLSGSTLNDFAVWGVTWNPDARVLPSSQFFGTKVTKNGSAWEYAPLRFWADGENYRFSALAPYIDRGAGSCLEVTQNVEEITSFADVKGGLAITFDNGMADADIDLCYAFKKLEKVTANQAPVELVFSHMLSRVKFTFKNGFPSMLSAIKITDLQIEDATPKAKIDKVADEQLWTDASNATTFVIPFTMQPREGVLSEEKDYILGGGTASGGGDGGRAAQNQQESDHHYIFPLNEGKAYTVTFTVTLYNYDPTTGTPMFAAVNSHNHRVTLPAIEYINNYSYNFVAEIDENNIDPEAPLSPIVFNPSVAPWDDFTDHTADVPVGTGTGGETPQP